MDPDATADGIIARHGLQGAAADAVRAALWEAAGRSDALPTTFGDGHEPDVHTLAVGDLEALDGPAVSMDGDLDRYEDLGQIGQGGMGEVRRMRDRRLGRVVAVKLLRPDVRGNPQWVARFLGEAQIAAQLQHPGLIPVHDVGRAPDGRVWFAMKEVRGQGLDRFVRDVHRSSREGWREGERSGWSLHRLVDAFAKVCDAMGYAHSRGVVHRDLKPENIMVGAHGEVLVLDWGIAKVLGERTPDADEEAVSTTRTDADSFRTRQGAVAGTVMYMAPEQARGRVDQVDARTDVYALGAILYEILTGTAPYVGPSAAAILQALLDGPPAHPRQRLRDQGRDLALPSELVALCRACLQPDRADRPAHGAEVGRAARAWLEGARRQDRALALVGDAKAFHPEGTRLREEASALRAEAEALLDAVAAWEPESRKAAGWALEDRADALEAQADMLEVRAELLLGAALTVDPSLQETHRMLARSHLREHVRAEQEGDDPRAARAALRLQEHASALPSGHPDRVAVDRYLAGTGALTLHSEPSGAEVTLYHYALRDRRLVPERVEVLGRTPLVEVPLEMGSWLCELRAPGRATVRYPVHIPRGRHWDGAPPGTDEPVPIALPAEDALGPDDCVVPAGWFVCGGDPAATGALPGRTVWCDAFVIRRHPVRFAEYLVFLHDLLDRGLEERALRYAPRERGSEEAPGALLLPRDRAGRFTLPEPWTPDHPVLMVDWACASAFAAWEAARTGLPWRLPGELEWEKAGRGVDGRLFPWGDRFDASRACLEDSHPGVAGVLPVDTFPLDESPYGVRGLAGNVRDWCLDVWSPDGPLTPDGRVEVADRGDPTSWRVRRGGSWGDMPGRARMADRDWYHPTYRFDYLGIRLARPL